MQASGNSSGEDVYGNNNQGYNSRIFVDKIAYTLSANTQLNVTAEALNYIETTASAADVTAGLREYAASSSTLGLYGKGLYGNIFDYDSKGLISYSYENNTAIKLNEFTLLSLTHDNIGAQELTGFITGSIGTDGTSFTGYINPPSAVPVPAALPLMASALGLFGLGAKRRKALKA